MIDTVKLSVNVPREEVDMLRQLAAQRKTTMTEVLRQAIATENFLTNELQNAKIIAEEPDGSRTQLVFRAK